MVNGGYASGILWWGERDAPACDTAALSHFAVDGRLVVVCGGGSVRGCTIVTALELAPQYRSLAAVGPIPGDHAAWGGTCIRTALRRKAVKEGRRSQQAEAL